MVSARRKYDPARARRPPFHDQFGTHARLAVPRMKQFGRSRPALRIEATRLRQHLHNGRLTGTVLADQHRQPRRQFQVFG